ncbi:hypothetical protein C482_01971 [Natrialba chahannaoensis JCM 10990]|uniref:Alpha/beta hydrolase n=1 Tax=Natrialba chahannaoensis JCM 10990 TaxID=1227492 RepID=M0B4A0_9EURY|nr:hypothetical protein [Natrialba chahannaoensis]ELZ05640.1 hypothetical protein C482_01971 [Natrialba chahannaoensis JCM 10990]
MSPPNSHNANESGPTEWEPGQEPIDATTATSERPASDVNLSSNSNSNSNPNPDPHSNSHSTTTPSSSTTRRSILAVTGATVAGLAGTAAASTSAAALCSDIDTIEIDDRFFGWCADGTLPVADEVYVFIHGWFGDSTAQIQAESVLNTIEDSGYEPDDAVVLEWPASTLNYFGAESDTEDVGEVAAELAEEFYDDGGGNLRFVGHSLGGRCVLWTAAKLSSGYELETVAPLGAAADGSEVCGEPWNDGLENACEVRNYHSENDSTVGAAYGGFFDTALGNEGADCDPASNYTDVDVTDDVSSHMDFLGNEAVGVDIADAILDGNCGADNGDDDDDDGGWW